VTDSGDAPLRIAQIAPVAVPVRRGLGESVEQLISVLTDELVARGHQVTLFATADSQTTAELRSLWEAGYELDDDFWDWRLAEAAHASHAYSQAGDFDVIHNHGYHYGLPFAQLGGVPSVQTHHVEIDPKVATLYARFGTVQIVAVSRHQARMFGAYPRIELIPHGIETAAFPFGEQAGDYLMFLGRMIEDKGPREAIQIARAARMPLVLAGPAEDGFDQTIAPLLDADVTFVGRVQPAERDRLLAGAGALVYPLLYPEPFGLVPIEAMACGTPVLGTAIGAVPELVEQGVTGYLAPSWEGLAQLVPRALELDRATVMARTRERFDVKLMVDRHEALYRRLAAEARTS
jgi:glycosyltransferase involved in cell wall biosynthesis